jgi:hypothetical protein
VVIVTLAACGGDDGLRYDVNPGGRGSGSAMGGPDANVGDASGDGAMPGFRVCLIDDARSPTTCASSGAGGLSVTLGNAQATTAADGSFTLTRPGSDLTWRVSGTGVVPSALVDTDSTTQIPVIGTNVYDDMLSANDAVMLAGDGSVIIRVTDNNVPKSGITASTSPTSDSAVNYDGSTATAWTDVATGSAGVVWIPSVIAGSPSILLDDGSQNPPSLSVPVFDGTITFAFYEIP